MGRGELEEFRDHIVKVFQYEMRAATDPSRLLLPSSRPPPLQRLNFWWRTKLANEQRSTTAGAELLLGLDIVCR